MAKQDENLLTLAAFKEMIELNELIFTAVQEADSIEIGDNGEIIMTGESKNSAFKDICKRHNPISDAQNWKKNDVDFNCVVTAKPWDFAYKD